MSKSKFTKEQEYHICYVIGEWYLMWKHKIADGKPHHLGFAKEQLKEMLCPDEKWNNKHLSNPDESGIES